MSKAVERIRRLGPGVRAIAATALGCAMAGCVSTSVEFDRMTGTAFPTTQNLGGESWDLKGIYAKAGTLLNVGEDNTSIAPLTNANGTAKACITDAELDSLMATNRSSPVGPVTYKCGLFNWFNCSRYHVYGIVVNHLGTSGGSCSSGLLGRMWDSTQRSAFVMFYKNSIISGDGQKYLRSAAHEIGHAFNLHHEDGDGESTIMNQTGVVGDDFTYEFEEHSKTHLKSHPEDCRYPGTGAFYVDVAEHDGWHSNINIGCTP